MFSIARRFPNTKSIRCFSTTYKTSTGLVGYPVDPLGKENLIKISSEVLKSVTKIPETADYRKEVEGWFKFIHKVALEKPTIREIEQEIDLGQIEELIKMAKDELELIDYYYEEKGWVAIEETKAQADRVLEEMADVIYFSHKPPPKPAPPAK